MSDAHEELWRARAIAAPRHSDLKQEVCGMNEPFVTKDSGAREAFASGMVRDTEAGKIKWHLLFSGPMLRRWAELLTRGAEKYEDDNWMKANGAEELRRFRASASRHFCQWMLGDTDEDHAAAVVFNLNGAEYVRERMVQAAQKEARTPHGERKDLHPGQ